MFISDSVAIIDNQNEKKDKYSSEIINSIVNDASNVRFDDIGTALADDVTYYLKAGLEGPKAALQETLVYPNLRPDIFTGLRAPPKGRHILTYI